MRHAISWTDLAGSKVGLWGLGVEGQASLRRLDQLGIEAVLVDDRLPGDRTASAPDGRPVLSAASGGLDALAGCEVVIKSPGISRNSTGVKDLESAAVVVVGGLGLWFGGAPLDRVIAVTGTKGKSTTAAMCGHLLDALGHSSFVGGNIGRLPYDPAENTGREPDFWVIEVSSYQATDVAVSPPVVAVTSLHPDHLDWHGSVEQYYADKLSLCTQPGAKLTIAAATSDALVLREALLGPRVEWVYADPTRQMSWHRELGVRGQHNLDNAEIARRSMAAVGVTATEHQLATAAAGYSGLEHRLQTIAVVDGVEFVDDSLSTNVLPTLRAIEAFADSPTAVIVGGHDRGIDYAPLAAGLAGRQSPLLVITIPESGDRIRAALEAEPLPNSVTVTSAESLPDAVTTAFGWSKPGSVVLLSPAAPSFGTFRDYRHRADVFAEAARSLSAEGR